MTLQHQTKETLKFAQVARFQGVGVGFEISMCPIPYLGADVVPIKITLAALCGSELHTFAGRRAAALPCVLGHEAVGTVAGPTEVRTADGKPLRVGERVTWSMTVSCGACSYCEARNLPQKCERLFKYGHAQDNENGALSGGFATDILLRPGTAIYRIPDSVTDTEAVSANCALSTVINGLNAIGTQSGATAVVHGAGMLGIYAACYLREQSYRVVAVVDKNPRRLQVAEQFGATHTFHTDSISPIEIGDMLKQLTEGHGVALAVEVSGAPSALPALIDWVTIGGKCLTLGYVYPEANVSFDAHQLVTKCVTLRGLHNYHPDTLGRALRFLEATRERYPFATLVGKSYPLSEIDSAFAHAIRQDAIRIAIRP